MIKQAVQDQRKEQVNQVNKREQKEDHACELISTIKKYKGMNTLNDEKEKEGE